MHILFVTYEFVAEKNPCSGLGNYIANISNVLAEKGHHITILIISNHNSTYIWKENIDVITFKYNYINNKNKTVRAIELFTKVDISRILNRSLAINDRVKAINRKTKIDIVQYCGDDMAVWYRVKGIPSVVRLSSFGSWYAQAYQPDSNMQDEDWLNTWESKILLYSLKKADAVYGPSTYIAHIVEKKLKQSVGVIESPCMINKDAIGENSFTELNGKKYLLFFGRINVLKGSIVIKEAIYDILNKNPQLLFVFAGKEENNMMKEIGGAALEHKHRVLYLGEIKDSLKLYSVIKNAFACVLPSRADNLPNTCIEALGCGRIVIGTYGAGFEQLIEHKKSGLLIKQDSPKALIKAIDYLMSMSDGERKEMEENAVIRAEKMKPDKIYEQLILFYKAVINNKKKKFFRRNS